MTPMSSLDDPRSTGGAHATDGVVTHSPLVRLAFEQLERVAAVDTTVLITGETGTGKELAARALHRMSRRAARAFIAVNLAAIPESLVASELFGHEQGAFTGAVQRRIGRFEIADRATLFLDEVGELSPDMQLALLRFLQEGEFERLGGSQTRHVDVRVIAATNRSLEEAVEQGRFRLDLYYRLRVFPVHLPPLRERREDIPTLVDYFLRRLISRLGRTFSGVDPVSMEQLRTYSWPGNIRQLQNVVEHSAILCDDPVLKIPAELIAERQPGQVASSRLEATLNKSEQHLIETALQETEGRVAGPSGAATRLGVPASTLESKIKRYKIDKFRYRAMRT
jgi:formate hydrogenlyase transcriptional activator